MKKRIGLTGTLAAISVSLAMSAVATPVVAQEAEISVQSAIDPDVLCRLILESDTPDAFRSIEEAVEAFNDPTNVCHDVASKHYAKLTLTAAEPQLDSLADTTIGDGYEFQ